MKTPEIVVEIKYEPGFPIWMHHKNHEPKIFFSSSELKEAGPGWVHTKAELEHLEIMPLEATLEEKQVDAILEAVIEPKKKHFKKNSKVLDGHGS